MSESKKTVAVSKKQTEITSSVLAKINAFQETGEISLPSSYSAPNALKGAYLILRETKTRDKKPVLEACSQESIANALLKMVVQGLTPLKKQGSFIAYGKQLDWVTEYAGNVALAKRYGKLDDIVTNVIYKGDDFEFGIDTKTGRKKIIKHNQTLESIGSKDFVGVYSIFSLTTGKVDIDIMSKQQVIDSWNQGAMKGNGPHKTFVEAMVKKTSINRACKMLIRTSDDAILYDGKEKSDIDVVKSDVDNEVSENANQETIDIDSIEVKSEEITPEKITEEKVSDNVDTNSETRLF